MTRGATIRTFAVLLAAGTMALNARDLASLYWHTVSRYLKFSSSLMAENDIILSDKYMREQVRDALPEGSNLLFIPSEHPGRFSLERSMQIGLVWAMLPGRVSTNISDGIGAFDGIVAAKGMLECAADRCGSDFQGEFVKCAETWGHGFWARRDLRIGGETAGGEITSIIATAGMLEDKTRGAPALEWEFASVAAFAAMCAVTCAFSGFGGMCMAVISYSVLILLTLVARIRVSPCASILAALAAIGIAFCATRKNMQKRKSSECRTRSAWWWVVSALLAFAILIFVSFVTLSLTLDSPNGLGVVGGRAKLAYLRPDLTGMLLKDSAMRLLEPAYPPGLTLIVLGLYGFSGGCGEWLTELVGVIPVVLIAVYMFSRVKSPCLMLLVFSFLANEIVVLCGARLYPEPFLWLCLIVGWGVVTRNPRDYSGWLILGAAGWFKNEGLILVVAAWLALRLVGGDAGEESESSTPGLSRPGLPQLVAAIAIPLAWHILARLCGAGLNDYGGLGDFNVGNCILAASGFAKLAFSLPWSCSLLFSALILAPVAILVLRAEKPSMRNLARAVIFAAVCIAAFVAIYGFSMSPDIRWHIGTSLPRLLYAPVLVLLMEITSVLDFCLQCNTLERGVHSLRNGDSCG